MIIEMPMDHVKYKELASSLGKPWWFWRCSEWTCQKRWPFLAASVWIGLQTRPATLLSMLFAYSSLKVFQPPVPEDLVLELHVGHTQSKHFMDVCPELETSAGKSFCKTTMLRGSVEADATGLRHFWIPQRNVYFPDQIQEVERKCCRAFKAYPCHLRVLGLMQRHGSLICVFLRLRCL